MKLFLEKMLIENFKGISRLEINFSENTAIFARNGLGKTSIADAFYWVLFNKDSAGHSAGNDNFRVKPLDVAGNEIHNLETNVVLTCKLDDQPFTLRRLQVEKWTKKRGHAEHVFEGNVSTYWINGVETGADEFRSRIASIATEDTFDIIAVLSRFNALDWKKRREMLIGMSGVDVDARLLANEDYQTLNDMCRESGVKVADLRKVLNDQKKGLKRDLDAVPIRIDEVKKSIVHVTDDEAKEAEYIINETSETIAKLDQMIAAERAGVNGSDSLIRQNAINRQMLDMQTASKHERSMESEKIKTEIRMREDSSISYSKRITEITYEMEAAKRRMDEAAVERDRLRAEYSRVYAETYTGTVSDTCPTCGQRLPDDQIHRAAEIAKNEWFNDKKARLEAIKAKGSEAAKRCEATEYLNGLSDEMQRLESNDTENGAVLASLRTALAALESQPLSYINDPAYLALKKESDGMAAEHVGNTDKLENLQNERSIAIESRDQHKAVLDRRDREAEANKRIATLQAEHRALGDKMAELERLIMLAEKFVTERCKLLEESINDLFPTISWKLFDTQINGGIADTCICMIPCHGVSVPYASANTASRLYADIEIINVFSRFYGVQVPTFFDNKERVNGTPATEGQIITLSVSEDEQIRVENN